MLADRATIAHHLAHLAALTRDGEKAVALAKRHKTHGIDSGRGLRQAEGQGDGDQQDGTTEVKAIERVNKQHLVQALLMLATAETGTSVPNKKKLNALRRQPRPDSLRGDLMMMRDEG